MLVIDADLDLLIDGTHARLTGSGRSLSLESDRPAALWASISSAPLPAGLGQINGPRSIGGVAARLSRLGITIRVAGPDGELVRIGADAHSRLGRLVTGTRAVQFGTVRTIAPVAGTIVRQFVARLGATAIARVRGARRH